MKYSISVGMVHLILSFFAKRGIDTDRFCRELGLDNEKMSDPDARIPTAQMQAIWMKAIAETKVATLPLEFGMQVNPYGLGVVSYLLMNCETLRMALEKLCLYQDVACAGVKTVVTREGNRCRVKLEVVDDAITESYAVDSEMSTYPTLINALLGGTRVPIDSVEFIYPRPGDISTYIKAFGTENIAFEKSAYSFSFPAKFLESKIPHANPGLFPLFEKHLDDALAKVQQSGSLSYKVQQQILLLLKGEEPKLTMVARALGIGERSIQLKLSEEGTSFRELLDGVRKDIALAHLKDNKLSTTDISFLLGFSEPSVFSRTFKKWTGQSPNTFRRELINS